MIGMWLVLGLLGYYLCMRFRYITDALPKFDKSTILGYIRGFMFTILLGPLSIGFFIYLLWRFNRD